MIRVSIIIPTYNEAKSCIKLIRQIKKILNQYSYEVLLIDDNSPDNTYSLVEQSFKNDPHVRCYLHRGRRDLGDSIYLGFIKSRGQIIIGMDGDGNHDPHLLPRLIKGINQYDMVIASRFIRGGGMAETSRYFASKLFNLVLRFILRFPITDNTSGFYAIKKNSLLKLNPKKIYYGYGEYHLRLVYYAQAQGLTIHEIPTWYQKRRFGTSKSHLGHMIISYIYVVLGLLLRPYPDSDSGNRTIIP